MGRHAHFAVLILVLPAGAAASSEPPMISQLDWLIGNWNYEDRSINGDYRETGVRLHYAAMRPAGATARAMLITAAAQWLGKDENTLPALMHRVASAKVRCRP